MLYYGNLYLVSYFIIRLSSAAKQSQGETTEVGHSQSHIRNDNAFFSVVVFYSAKEETKHHRLADCVLTTFSSRRNERRRRERLLIVFLYFISGPGIYLAVALRPFAYHSWICHGLQFRCLCVSKGIVDQCVQV